MTNSESNTTKPTAQDALQLTFVSLPSHGYLEVRLDLVEALIKPSCFSYKNTRQNVAYLEEDCDAPALINALKNRGISFEIDSYSENNEIVIRRNATF